MCFILWTAKRVTPTMTISSRITTAATAPASPASLPALPDSAVVPLRGARLVEREVASIVAFVADHSLPLLVAVPLLVAFVAVVMLPPFLVGSGVLFFSRFVGTCPSRVLSTATGASVDCARVSAWVV